MKVDWPNRAEGEVVRAWLPGRAPNPVVVALTAVARGDALWVLICAGLASRRGVSRRAAIRAGTALAAATAVSHGLGRVLPYRRRPHAGDLPARRALPEHPHSSSFPSAHATSAAAVTTALALESRPLGAVVAPLAVLVTYGRVRTRVHWPTDVGAGTGLGILTALLTRQLPGRWIEDEVEDLVREVVMGIGRSVRTESASASRASLTEEFLPSCGPRATGIVANHSAVTSSSPGMASKTWRG
jgi:membrane-associated phospholipid phosphatase